MIFLKSINKRNNLLNITAVLTVISLFVYVFAFSLPHDLHCFSSTESSFFSYLIETFEKTHHDDDSNKTDKKDSSDNCPICNLSYFNGLYFTEPLVCKTILIETNEKPVNITKSGLSSFSFFKFFLRSPPSFKA